MLPTLFRNRPFFSFSVSYKNIGNFAEQSGRAERTPDSDEVVQVYFDKPESAVPRPIRKLCGFARVHLKAGEQKTVKVTIPAYILQIYDTHSGRMLTESGVYRFFAGGSSAELPLSAEYAVNGETIGLRGAMIPAASFDGAFSIEIHWSRVHRCHYLRARGWAGTAVYNGVPLKDAKALRLSVVSPIKPCELTVQIGSTSLQLPVHTSNSIDDFAAYTLALPAGLPESGTIIVTLPEAVQLRDITVC